MWPGSFYLPVTLGSPEDVGSDPDSVVRIRVSRSSDTSQSARSRESCAMKRSRHPLVPPPPGCIHGERAGNMKTQPCTNIDFPGLA